MSAVSYLAIDQQIEALGPGGEASVMALLARLRKYAQQDVANQVTDLTVVLAPLMASKKPTGFVDHVWSVLDIRKADIVLRDLVTLKTGFDAQVITVADLKEPCRRAAEDQRLTVAASIARMKLEARDQANALHILPTIGEQIPDGITLFGPGATAASTPPACPTCQTQMVPADAAGHPQVIACPKCDIYVPDGPAPSLEDIEFCSDCGGQLANIAGPGINPGAMVCVVCDDLEEEGGNEEGAGFAEPAPRIPTPAEAGLVINHPNPTPQPEGVQPTMTHDMNVVRDEAAFDAAKARAIRLRDRYQPEQTEERLKDFQNRNAAVSVLEELGLDIVAVKAKQRAVQTAIGEREDQIEIDSQFSKEKGADDKPLTVDQKKARVKESKLTDPELKGLRKEAADLQTELETVEAKFYARRKELAALESQSLLVFAQLMVLGSY